jgi:hypothetical protein
MSTQYRLVQSGKTASGGCSAGPRFVRAVAPRIIIIIMFDIHDAGVGFTVVFGRLIAIMPTYVITF